MLDAPPDEEYDDRTEEDPDMYSAEVQHCCHDSGVNGLFENDGNEVLERGGGDDFCDDGLDVEPDDLKQHIRDSRRGCCAGGCSNDVASCLRDGVYSAVMDRLVNLY